jgi:hypothetical protein
MGRFPNWIIVGALVVLVAVAAADALRPGSGTEPKATPAAPAAKLSGVLVTAGADCSVRAIRLQDRAEQALIRPVDCDGAVWSADRTLNASCARGVTTVAAVQSDLIFRFSGCSPAWRPDGAVTFIDDGDLFVARRRGRPQIFLSREELANSLAGALRGGKRYELVEVAWHGTDSFAGIVVGPEPAQRAVIVYGPEGVTSVIPQIGREISGVRVSPLGNVAFRDEGKLEYVMVDPLGAEIPLPRVGNVFAIAWSEEERWTALTTRNATSIAETGTRRVVARVPIGGEEVEWLE